MKKKGKLTLLLKYHFQHNKVLIFLNIILFGILMITLNVNVFNVAYNFKVGDIAPFNIVSPKDMSYIDTEATNREAERVKSEVVPIFNLDMRTYESKEILLEEIKGIINDASLFRKDKIEKLEGLLRPLLEEKELLPFDYDNLLAFGKLPDFFERVKSQLYQLYLNGIYKPVGDEYDINELVNKVVHVRVMDNSDQGNRVKRDFRKLDKLLLSDMSYVEYFSFMRKKLGLDKMESRRDLILIDLLYLLSEDNLYINTHFTQEEIANRLKKIKPIKKNIKESEVIVRTGDRIDQETLDKIKELRGFQRKNLLKKTVFTLFLSLFFILIVTISLRIGFPDLFYDLKKMTLIYIFVIFNCFLIYVFFNLLSTLSFPLGILFPIGFTVYILSITMNRQVAFLMNVLVSFLYLIFLVVYRTDTLYSLLYIFAVGTIMNLLTSNIIRRDQIIQSSLYSIFPYLIFTFIYLFYFPNYLEDQERGLAFLWSALNPVLSAVMSIGLIPVFERVFNMVTPFRLMELSNLSNKILSDMHLLAPGTYHHSILVSHLVEAACKEIGANYLLGRVGSLYHDIGKLSNPKYFAENMEFGGYSIHEEISPQFSASILKKHVLEGVRMATDMILPEEVKNFIPEHHGTSMMEFFYIKAQEMQKEKAALENIPESELPEIDITSFRYGGPKPRSKETSILMLADGVEAGVRSLPSKRYDLIENKVTQIINNKLNQGELSESPLNLQDIKKIEIVFKKLMFAYYHVRPSYPSDKEPRGEDEYASQY